MLVTDAGLDLPFKKGGVFSLFGLLAGRITLAPG
jgi:hypothetical protein